MYTETLKEVLMPLNNRQVEYFNEATKDCSPEQKLAVAKRIAQEKLPDGWQFTQAAIKRFAIEESLSKLNWYPGISINEASGPATNIDAKFKTFKERQFAAYRAGGMSEAEARRLAGL